MDELARRYVLAETQLLNVTRAACSYPLNEAETIPFIENAAFGQKSVCSKMKESPR